jgi:hypothetical protein
MRRQGTRGVVRAVATAALIGGALCLVGCGTSPEDVCDSLCDCQGCSDRQYDDCVEAYERAQDQAERYGCGDEYEDYLDCLDDTLECRYGRVDWDYGNCNDYTRHCWPDDAPTG